jgi:SNF2 family DNA or RNA helicase
VHELWSIYDFLMPGFLGTTADFRKRYERPIKDRQDQGALDRLRTRIRPFMLRRTKAALLKDLPPKVEQTMHAPLTPEQLVVYTRTLEEVRENVMKAVAEKGFAQSRIEILTALMKLRRICDHPALVDPRLPKTEEMSGKMSLALELVRQAVEGGHKVLLFSQFTGMLDLLRESLDELGIGHATIEGKTRDREGEIKKFSKDPKIPVFLLSLRAGGTGLTLTEADTVILFDPWWNPMVEAQAMDRAHRIGQTKAVNVYKLVTKGSVEEKVMELQVRKRQLFDALVQESEADLGALTWEDVQGLLA